MVVPAEEEEVLVNPLDNLLDEEQPETPAVKAENSHQEKEAAKAKDEPAVELTPEAEAEAKAEEEKKAELTAKEKRHAEQQDGAKKEVDKLRAIVVEESYEKAQSDVNVLLELGKKDPLAAEAVAKKFGYDTFKEAKAAIHAELWIAKAEPMSDEEKDAYYQERRTKEIHEEATQEAKATFNDLSEEAKAQALIEFDDLAEWKVLTREKALKIADMISLSLNKGKAKTDAYKAGVKQLTDTWIRKVTKSDKDEDDQPIVVNGKLITLSSKNTK